MRTLRLFLLLATLGHCSPSLAGAPVDGYLDTGFGANGVARIDPQASGFADSHSLNDVAAIASSGKFYLLSQGLGAGQDMLLTRMHANGSLDTGFNGDGYATALPDLANSFGMNVYRVAVAADGKPIVAGVFNELEGMQYDPQMLVCRLFVAGNADTGFSGDGCFVFEADVYNSLGADHVSAIWPLPDGSLLLAGEVQIAENSYRPYVAKLLEDGSFDTNFGLGGLRYFDMPGIDSAWVRRLAVGADGAVYVSGKRYAGEQTSTFVAKFNASGAPVSTYGDNGVAATSFVNEFPQGHQISQDVTGLAVDATGRAWQCGYSYNYTSVSQQISLVRYDADGQLDPAFDGDGRVFLSFSELNAINETGSCMLDRRHRLTLALDITSIPVFSTELAVMRFRENGSTDEDFQGAGRLLLPLNFGENGVGTERGAFVLPQGEDVVVFVTASLGDQQDENPNELAAVRLRNDRTFTDGFESMD